MTVFHRIKAASAEAAPSEAETAELVALRERLQGL
jgi:hypothetical protein